MDDRRRALIFALAGAACLSAMAVFAKQADGVGVVEKVFSRNLIMLAVAGAVLARNGGRPLGRRPHRPRLLLRALLGMGGVLCYFYAIDHLLLADAALLNKLSPFFALAAAWIFLAERPGRSTLVALGVAFGGAILVIKPRLDLTVIPALVGLASALFAGSAYTVVRSLREKEPPETIVFVFSLVTVVLLLPPVVAGFMMPRPIDLLWILGIGLSAAAGQFGLTHAFRHGPAAEVALYSYTTIVFSALAGLVIFDEWPDALSIAGGMLVLLAAVLVYRGARSREEAARVAAGGSRAS